MRQQPAFFLGDVLLGEGADRAFDLEAAIVGQVEFGPDFHLEFVDEWPFLGNFQLGRVEVGHAQGRDLLLFAQLFQAGHEHGHLDLVVDLLAKLADDDLARGLAGPEAGHHGVAFQFLDLFIDQRVDVVPAHGHLDVLLAGADVLDLDDLVELFLGLGFAMVMIVSMFVIVPMVMIVVVPVFMIVFVIMLVASAR